MRFKNLFKNKPFQFICAASGTQMTHLTYDIWYWYLFCAPWTSEHEELGRGVCLGRSLPCGVMIWAGLAGMRTFHVVSVPSEWLHTNCFPSWCQATEWIAYRPNKGWVINHKKTRSGKLRFTGCDSKYESTVINITSTKKTS